MTTAPAVMSRPPMRARGVSFSPSRNQAQRFLDGFSPFPEATADLREQQGA